MVLYFYHLLLRDGGEEFAKKIAVLKRILGEGNDLAVGPDVESCTQLLQPLQVGQPIELAEQLHGFAEDLLLVIFHLLLVDGEGAVAVSIAGLLDGLVRVVLAYVIELIFLDVGHERLPLNIVKVVLDGTDAHRLELILTENVEQFLIDESPKVFHRIIGIPSGKELVKYLVSCLGVFVCWHNCSYLLFPTAKVQNPRAIFLRTNSFAKI